MLQSYSSFDWWVKYGALSNKWQLETLDTILDITDGEIANDYDIWEQLGAFLAENMSIISSIVVKLVKSSEFRSFYPRTENLKLIMEHLGEVKGKDKLIADNMGIIKNHMIGLGFTEYRNY